MKPLKNNENITETTSKTEFNSLKEEDITIFVALDQIIATVEGKHLNLEIVDKLNPAIPYLTKKLDLTPVQAILLAPIANCSPHITTIDDIAHFFNCTNIHVMRYAKELDSLMEKRIVRYKRTFNAEGYCVPKNVMNAFKENKVYLAEEYKDYTTEKIFEFSDEMYCDIINDKIEWQDFISELRTILKVNKTLSFAKKIKDYNLMDEDFFILMVFCLHYIYNNDIELNISTQLSFMRRRDSNRHLNAFRSGTHVLQDLNLIENAFNDGMADPNRFMLTNFAKRELLSEVSPKAEQEKNTQLTYVDSIIKKTMYYNPTEEKLINQLASLLEPERFSDIQKRLKECGMRTGFACLFYGAPGTGKTETVLQLAKQTGRNIMQVNISDIKSKWVGESEKNIKEIFDRYHSFVKKNKVVPILFFNEADAIFGTRLENTRHAVDKMENSIQNIILQEMENLNGILIATTNLSNNLDKAFERRFLYKIKFQKPNEEALKSIWKSMIPDLDNETISELAMKYDFSGGQIENIARKKTIQSILDGEKISLTQLQEFCDAEKLDKKERKIVGFGR